MHYSPVASALARIAVVLMSFDLAGVGSALAFRIRAFGDLGKGFK
jgi:hypothetical protein